MATGAEANKVLTTDASGVASWQTAGGGGEVPWSNITSKPTTVAGYGITDMGSQSVNYAATANTVTTPVGGYKHLGAWGVGRTAAGAILVNTAYTSDYATYATTAGNADTVDGHHFNWSGQSGQPTWLWGGNSSADMYVYNPSNFSVAYAASAGIVNNIGDIGCAWIGSGSGNNTYTYDCGAGKYVRGMKWRGDSSYGYREGYILCCSFK